MVDWKKLKDFKTKNYMVLDVLENMASVWDTIDNLQ